MMGHGVWMLDGGQPSFGDQVFERLLRERIIFLGTEVTDAVGEPDLRADPAARRRGPGPGHLPLHQLAGRLGQRRAWPSTTPCGYVKNDVATLAMGMAGSMGQFLLCAGTAGKRFALPHSRIMMHQPSGGMGGTAADITIQAENMLHVKRTMQELIAEHSGRTLDEIQRDWDRDRWFTAEQAREYGLIDRVLSSAEQLPA